ncbi:MAG: hypothetical protein H2212_12780 [Ruminococcus sp.]|jgi:hypothetical protein|nr:hypothetical protein [Ruminococcus sp.]
MEKLNRCAMENVKNHLVVQMSMCEKAEKKAKEEGMTTECIEMHHDMFCLYAGFLAQLD